LRLCATVLVLGVGWMPGFVASAAAAPPATATEPLKVYAYTLKNQRATDALGVIQPLLSPRGTVELRPSDNTLVVRDTPATVTRVATALRGFDRPPRELTIEVLVVRAQRAAFSPIVTQDNLPEPLASRLRQMLPYSSYVVLAQTEVHSREGEEVTYEVGEGYRVSFRPGTLLDEGQLKLHDFRISRNDRNSVDKGLFHSTLNLRLDKPLALGLAPTEASERALVVVVTPKLD
jgi:Bacterial type II/III secretion system short domain